MYTGKTYDQYHYLPTDTITTVNTIDNFLQDYSELLEEDMVSTQTGSHSGVPSIRDIFLSEQKNGQTNEEALVPSEYIQQTLEYDALGNVVTETVVERKV